MTFSWVFAGAKAQGLGILDAAQRSGFVPSRIAVPKGLPDDDRSRLEAWARAADAEIIAPGALTSEHVADVDLLLVCRFELLGAPVFEAPRWGTLNVHSSLLPAYRGVHPVSWALVDGAEVTGVTVHRVDAGIDTGAIVAQRSLAIHDDHDFHSLTADLDAVSAELVTEQLVRIDAVRRIPTGRPQVGAGSYARRRGPEDGRIDWSLTAQDVRNLTRALPAPLPAAFTFESSGRRVELRSARVVDVAPWATPGTVLSRGRRTIVVQCGEGAVELTVVGVPPRPGARLGEQARAA